MPVTWKTAPVTPKTIEEGATWTAQTVVAQGGTGPYVYTTSPVDTSKVGKVTVTYTATDSASPKATVTADVALTVTAKAIVPLSWKTPPKATSTMVQNGTFAYETPVAENGTAPIAVTHSTLDTSKVGTFDVTYTATDSASTPVVITAKTSVTITAAYVAMTWKTAPTATKSITVGDKFVFETPVAENGTAPIVITHDNDPLDTTTAKTVTITYTATDKTTKTLTGTTIVTIAAAAPKPAVKLANPVLTLGTLTETGLTATWPDVPNATNIKSK